MAGEAAKGGLSGDSALPVESDMATMRVEHEEACRRPYLNLHTSEAKSIHRSGHAFPSIPMEFEDCCTWLTATEITHPLEVSSTKSVGGSP